eukprot:g1945.t1
MEEDFPRLSFAVSGENPVGRPRKLSNTRSRAVTRVERSASGHTAATREQHDSNLIWYEDAQEAWLLGEYIPRKAEEENQIVRTRVNDVWTDVPTRKLMVLTQSGRAQQYEEWRTKAYFPEHMLDFDDISKMNGMNEASLIGILRRRFQRKKAAVYTYVSDVLVAINPFHSYSHLGWPPPKPLPIFKRGEEPHVWAFAQFSSDAIQGHGSVSSNVSQSIIVSGESGAGKTYTCSLVLKYLGRLSEKCTREMRRSVTPFMSGKNVKSVEERIKAVEPILEAFGNAKTLRNDNSSRFGKFLKIYYSKGRILGGEMESYLLEKSRVTDHSKGHRNFHIFYFLTKNATPAMRQKYQLLEPHCYNYLNIHDFERNAKGKKTGKRIDGWQNNYNVYAMKSDGSFATDENGKYKIALDDKEEFIKLVGNEKMTGAWRDVFGDGRGKVVQDNLYTTLSAILRLGNIDFEKEKGKKSKCLVQSNLAGEAAILSQLLGLAHLSGDKSIERHLATQLRVFPGEPMSIKERTPKKARAARDALAKELYHRMFRYVISICNESLKIPENGRKSVFIGMLDIFGFEIFANNGFEQLCINYCNEKLQYMFNDHIFNQELIEYKKENINVKAIKPPDNSPSVNLIESSTKVRIATGTPGKTSKGFVGILQKMQDLCEGDENPQDLQFGKSLHSRWIRNKQKIKDENEIRAVERFSCYSVVDVKRFKKSKSNGFLKGSLRRQAYPNDFSTGEIFVVQHFAGPVDYNVNDMLKKNKDALPVNVELVVGLSKNNFIKQLFPYTDQLTSGKTVNQKDESILDFILTGRQPNAKGDNPRNHNRAHVSGRRVKKKKKNYIGTKFRNNLNQLMNELNHTTPHYIRCVKPNVTRTPAHLPGSFDARLVQRQLLYGGVMEVVKIRQLGFPFRMEYHKFWNWCKDNQMDKICHIPKATPARMATRQILTKVLGPPVPSDIDDPNHDNGGLWTEGDTKVFGKDRTLQDLLKFRIQEMMRQLQPWSRYIIFAPKLAEFKYAVRKVQIEWRAEAMRRKYKRMEGPTLQLQSVIRAHISRAMFEKRLVVYKKRQKQIAAEAIVARAYRQFVCYNQWYPVSKGVLRKNALEDAQLILQKAWRNYNTAKMWERAAACLIAGDRLVKAALLIAKAAKNFRAYKLWHGMEFRYRQQNAMSHLVDLQMFIRRKLIDRRLIKAKEKAREAVALRHKQEKAARAVEGMLHAAFARARLARLVHNRKMASRLRSTVTVKVFANRRVKLFHQNRELRAQRNALNMIIRKLRQWHFEHEYNVGRNAALQIQAWWFYKSVYKRTLGLWIELMSEHVKHGRVHDLRNMILCKDPMFKKLLRFPNLINIRHRTKGTTFLHDAVHATTNAKKLCHFLMDCGSRIGEQDVNGDTPLQKSVEWGDGERLSQLRLTQFLVKYAESRGEDVKAIMALDNEEGMGLVDTCLYWTDEGNHASTLLWLLESGCEANETWEAKANEELQEILRDKVTLERNRRQLKQILERTMFEPSQDGRIVQEAQAALNDAANWDVVTNETGRSEYVNKITKTRRASLEIFKMEEVEERAFEREKRSNSLLLQSLPPLPQSPAHERKKQIVAFRSSNGSDTMPARTSVQKLNGFASRNDKNDFQPVKKKKGRRRSMLAISTRPNQTEQHEEMNETAARRKRLREEAEKKIKNKVLERVQKYSSKVKGQESIWLLRAVLALRRLNAPAKYRGWFYLDDLRKAYGPFKASRMRSWFEAGHFSLRTLIRYGNPCYIDKERTKVDERCYQPIGSVFPKSSESFPSDAKPLADLECAAGSLLSLLES